MRRGEVWLVELDPTVGSEANKTRRVSIVSNNARNSVSSRTGRGVLTVVPFTKNVRKILPFQFLVTPDSVNGLEVDSKAQAEQVRSLDVSRFVRRLGSLSAEDLSGVDEALLLHLGLS